MTTFAVTSNNQLLDSVNYLLSNINTGNATGNITIPDGTLVANVTTGQITATGNVTGGSNGFSYINQYINLRYANNASGSSGFSVYPTNANYFGVYNSNIATPSTNPAAYTWRQVAGGFGTTETIYYSSIGGRQVQFVAANSAPSSNFVVSVANVAIDLDVITTAAGLPGERGPIPMGYVITTADPATASSSTLTGWFSSSRTNSSPPIGTGLTPVTGDTAYFTYPTTGSSTTYTYNGSVWANAVGQVVSGNTIVANSTPGTALAPETITGDRIANVTLTGNLYAYGSISGDRIGVNTISGNNIQGDTITGNKIVANTITGGLIAANTITATNIDAATITGDKIAANTISGTNIVAATITGNLIAANTVSASSIVANSITSTQISSSYIYAGNIVSFGASIGNTSSPGYWLQYNTGNARFGGNVSIGNNLSVGANATIGSNLTVTGLISTGNLVANTVQTLTINSNAVSTFSTAFNPASAPIFVPSSTSGNWQYLGNSTVSVSTTNAPVTVYLNGSCFADVEFNPSTAWNMTVDVGIFQFVAPTTYTQVFNLRSETFSGSTTGTVNISLQADFAGYSEFISVFPTTRGFTYGIRVTRNSGTMTYFGIAFDNYNLQAQVLKR